MKLAGDYLFEAEVQEVWDALFDPAVLAAVMPGCAKLDLVDGAYVGEIVVKIGPIQGKFAGKVDLVDQVPPTSYKMIVDGKGAQGFVKATATITLVAEGTNTRVTYDADAQVGGKIATAGQRLVETSARAIVKQSLEGLAENVLIRSGAHRRAKAKLEAAPPEPVADAPIVVASPDLEAAPIAVEPITYKQADASKLAGAVAKEVGKTYAPIIGIVLLVLAIAIYLIRAMTERRRDFPALATRVHGKRLAYLDSAATALRPQAVIDAMIRAAQLGAPSRSVHALAEAATNAIDDARGEVARFLGGAADEVIFTSGTTASLNLVAQAWGRAHLGPGDAVIVSELEHHSNALPWHQICAERGAEVRIAPVDDAGRIAFDRVSFDRVKLVAVAHVSNVTGTIAPIAELSARAHAAGALVVVDGAQAVAHLPVDVAALGCDFYAFSAHKLYGPTGTGVLWGRAALLEALPPWQTGGGMVNRAPPARFEAGTPNVIGIAGLAAAIAYVRSGDARADEPRAHAELVRVIHAAGGQILGVPELAVVSFELPRVHPHDVATLADGEGVALRSGHHCAAPIHARFGVAASSRVSVGCYTDADDIVQFAAALAKIREVFP